MSLLATLAQKHDIDAKTYESTLRKTVMPKDHSNEQFAAFCMVCSKYDLNPITREIYAFAAKGGGIQPIVSIDGWLKIINTHPQFDGMETVDNVENGSLVSVTARIHRKDRKHPTEVTEYMDECRRKTEPWDKWPARMLRHKAVIQCARYAFSFSGIMEPDEYERMEEKDVTEQSAVIEPEPESKQEAVKQKLKKKTNSKNPPEPEPEPEVIEANKLSYAEIADRILKIESVNAVSEMSELIRSNIDAEDQKTELFTLLTKQEEAVLDVGF